MEGLSEDGGEGVEVSDRVTQIIKQDLPGLIIQRDPDSVTGEIGRYCDPFIVMYYGILIIISVQTPGLLINSNS